MITAVEDLYAPSEPTPTTTTTTTATSGPRGPPSNLALDVLSPPPPIALGHHSVLLTAPLLEALEVTRGVALLGMDAAASRITSLLRAWRYRVVFRRFRWAASILASGWKGRCVRLAFRRHCEAGAVVKRTLQMAVARRAYKATRHSVSVIQRVYRVFIGKARAARMARRIKAFTLLARGFTVRATVIKWGAAAERIQKAVRAWLRGTGLAKRYVGAIVTLQSAFRGGKARARHPAACAAVARLRRANTLTSLCRRTVALRKGGRVRGAFLLLKASCRVLSGWWRGLLVRRAYLCVRSAVAQLQGVVRGMLARKWVERVRAAQVAGASTASLKRLRQETRVRPGLPSEASG